MDFIPKNTISKNNLQQNQQHILTIIPIASVLREAI